MLIPLRQNVAKGGGGHKTRQSLLKKNIDGKVSKTYLYFHRIDTHCIINYDIKYKFTLKAVLIKAFLMKFFLVKGKSEILNLFIRCNYT